MSSKSTMEMPSPAEDEAESAPLSQFVQPLTGSNSAKTLNSPPAPSPQLLKPPSQTTQQQQQQLPIQSPPQATSSLSPPPPRATATTTETPAVVPAPARTPLTPVKVRPQKKTPASIPSFTQRRKMQRLNSDEQRWRRIDLNLIQYMSRLKEQYMQRQTEHDQQLRRQRVQEDNLDSDSVLNKDACLLPTNVTAEATDVIVGPRGGSTPAEEDVKIPKAAAGRARRSMIPVKSPAQISPIGKCPITTDKSPTEILARAEATDKLEFTFHSGEPQASNLKIVKLPRLRQDVTGAGSKCPAYRSQVQCFPFKDDTTPSAVREGRMASSALQKQKGSRGGGQQRALSFPSQRVRVENFPKPKIRNLIDDRMAGENRMAEEHRVGGECRRKKNVLDAKNVADDAPNPNHSPYLTEGFLSDPPSKESSPRSLDMHEEATTQKNESKTALKCWTEKKREQNMIALRNAFSMVKRNQVPVPPVHVFHTEERANRRNKKPHADEDVIKIQTPKAGVPQVDMKDNNKRSSAKTVKESRNMSLIANPEKETLLFTAEHSVDERPEVIEEQHLPPRSSKNGPRSSGGNTLTAQKEKKTMVFTFPQTKSSPTHRNKQVIHLEDTRPIDDFDYSKQTARRRKLPSQVELTNSPLKKKPLLLTETGSGEMPRLSKTGNTLKRKTSLTLPPHRTGDTSNYLLDQPSCRPADTTTYFQDLPFRWAADKANYLLDPLAHRAVETTNYLLEADREDMVLNYSGESGDEPTEYNKPSHPDIDASKRASEGKQLKPSVVPKSLFSTQHSPIQVPRRFPRTPLTNKKTVSPKVCQARKSTPRRPVSTRTKHSSVPLRKRTELRRSKTTDAKFPTPRSSRTKIPVSFRSLSPEKKYGETIGLSTCLSGRPKMTKSTPAKGPAGNIKPDRRKASLEIPAPALKLDTREYSLTLPPYRDSPNLLVAKSMKREPYKTTDTIKISNRPRPLAFETGSFRLQGKAQSFIEVSTSESSSETESHSSISETSEKSPDREKQRAKVSWNMSESNIPVRSSKHTASKAGRGPRHISRHEQEIKKSRKRDWFDRSHKRKVKSPLTEGADRCHRQKTEPPVTDGADRRNRQKTGSPVTDGADRRHRQKVAIESPAFSSGRTDGADRRHKQKVATESPAPPPGRTDGSDRRHHGQKVATESSPSTSGRTDDELARETTREYDWSIIDLDESPELDPRGSEQSVSKQSTPTLDLETSEKIQEEMEEVLTQLYRSQYHLAQRVVAVKEDIRQLRKNMANLPTPAPLDKASDLDKWEGTLLDYLLLVGFMAIQIFVQYMLVKT